MRKKIGGLSGLIIASVGALIINGCSDIPENNVEFQKTVSGVTSYKVGPVYEFADNWNATRQNFWDGRRVINLPLQKGSEQEQNYQTLDGQLSIEYVINYRLGQSKEERDKWFVTSTNAEEQFPLDAEGVARSTITQYTKAEVLNEELAKKHGKLPVLQQIQLDLYNSGLDKKYGIDNTAWAVWPGNISLLKKAVEADLLRQRSRILKEAEKEAQNYRTLADGLKATVDGEYSKFITKLSPEQQRYLQTLAMLQAVQAVSKAKQEQEVNINLFVE